MFGINYCEKNLMFNTALALHALQHRGAKSFDIAAFNGKKFNSMSKNGPVIKALDSLNPDFETTDCFAAIGQVYNEKYNFESGKQYPKIMHYWGVPEFPLATEGAITNTEKLCEILGDQPASDARFISGLIAAAPHGQHPSECVAHAMRQIYGAVSFIAIYGNYLIAARDPWGMKPLVMGRTPDGGTAFASETTALYAIGAKYVRDVAPGKIVFVKLEQNAVPESINIRQNESYNFCAFENIYTARPNAFINGRHTGEFREELGARIAAKFDRPVDIVVPVPDSGIPAATGFARAFGKPLVPAISRNHYGRSFTENTQESRTLQTILKLLGDPYLLKGKNIALVDDSIVRGTVMKNLVGRLKCAGTGHIHIVSSCPEIRHPCFYGCNTRTYDELISAKLDTDNLTRYLGADSVTFLSLADLNSAFAGQGFCNACMSGEYKVPMTDSKILAELKKRNR